MGIVVLLELLLLELGVLSEVLSGRTEGERGVGGNIRVWHGRH